MKGPLSEGVLATLLRDIQVGHLSGHLRIGSADHALDVLFREGRVMRVLAGGRPLTDATRAQEAVLAAADWQRAEYSFEENAAAPPVADVNLSVGDLALDLVRRIQDPDVVRFALGKLDRVLGVSDDALLRTQKLSLSPVDGFLLSRVDGTQSAREIVEQAPVPAEQAERSLLGLLCTGSIAYLDRPAKQRPVRRKTIRVPGLTPNPTRRPTQSTRRSTQSMRQQTQAPGPAAQPAPATTPPASRTVPPGGVRAEEPAPSRAAEATVSMRLRRQEVQHAYSTLKARNLYEVLGIERTASTAQVKDAYFRLARRFHPDAHRDPSLADVASQAEAVFLRVGEAYETLRDPRTREAYDARLPPLSSSRIKAVTAPSAPEPEPPKAERAAASPEPPPDTRETLKQAERLLGERQEWDAIRRLEPLLATARGSELGRALLLLGRAYRRNPESIRKAEETLTRATDSDPRATDAWMELGDFYESRGMKSRAATMYRKALATKPDHAEAAARIQRLEPPSPEPPAASGGILGRLLRRG
jgi:curved DNA-binding protein CbpA